LFNLTHLRRDGLTENITTHKRLTTLVLDQPTALFPLEIGVIPIHFQEKSGSISSFLITEISSHLIEPLDTRPALSERV
jgi:hypothetical protein